MKGCKPIAQRHEKFRSGAHEIGIQVSKRGGRGFSRKVSPVFHLSEFSSLLKDDLNKTVPVIIW